MILQSSLFDETFYRGQATQVGRRSALQHFVRAGNEEPHWPNPFFDPHWYLEAYPDVRSTKRNALAHYAEHGEAEGRQPNALFSPAWYATRYGLPSRAGALKHYLHVGRFAGVKPTASFNPIAYLATNPASIRPTPSPTVS